MSNEPNSDEIPVDVIAEKIKDDDHPSMIEPEIDEKIKDDDPSPMIDSEIDKLTKQLELEKQRSSQYEEKLKLALADFQNQSRKTQSDIENGINSKINEFALDFLQIYDDFIRAKKVFSESEINSDGLDSILKNMGTLLQKYHIKPIDALGEIFDPNYHEAISMVTDPNLDENTITKELRKGYLSHKRVIRPTLVEISKKE